MELLGRFELPTSSLPTPNRPFYQTFVGVKTSFLVQNSRFSKLRCSQTIPYFPFYPQSVPTKIPKLFPQWSGSAFGGRLFLLQPHSHLALHHFLHRSSEQIFQSEYSGIRDSSVRAFGKQDSGSWKPAFQCWKTTILHLGIMICVNST